MPRIGYCYQCDHQVELNNDLTCSQCGSEFTELQENQVHQSQPSSLFQTLFQGIQRNMNQLQSLYQTFSTAADLFNHASSTFDSPTNFQNTMNLLFRLFPQLANNDSIFNDENVNRLFQHLQNLNQLFSHLPPADQNVINSLTPQKYTNGICIDDTCAICLDKMQENEDVIVLPCRHGFHQNCIGTWLNAHNVCPTCRQSV